MDKRRRRREERNKEKLGNSLMKDRIGMEFRTKYIFYQLVQWKAEYPEKITLLVAPYIVYVSGHSSS